MPKTLKQHAIDIANAFTRWGLWQGGGASALADLTDVNLSDLQENDVLQYNGNKWINAIIQGGGGNVGAQIDTLWTNPSPLTAFSGQNITINTDYDLFIIDFRPNNNSTIHTTMLVNKVINRTYRLYCNSGSAQDQQYQRSFTVQNGYINFDDGLRPGIAWDNSLCIPTVIYGIKFAPIEPNLHEYSTEERVIGKWIDGKPIYEKVVIIERPNISTWTQFSQGLGISEVVKIDYYLFADDTEYCLNGFHALTNNDRVVVTHVKQSDVFWYYIGSNFNAQKVRYILQYTKTTD